jgi:methanogen homocitrate synthase
VTSPPELPGTANVLTGPFEARLAHRIELYDNTLREGEQPPGVVFDEGEKLELAVALDAAGVHWANIGFPAVSETERRSCERIAKAGLKMRLAALCRLIPDEMSSTVDVGVEMVSLFLGGSDTHLKHKHRITEAEAFDKVEAGVRHAKERGARIVSFMPEDSTRMPMARLEKMLRIAAEAGADYVGIADTVGVLTPSSTSRIVEKLKESIRVPIGVHFHDDLGLALANSLAAVEAGAELVHTTVNGVGERSGNTAFEELAVVLRVKYGRDLGIRLEHIAKLSAMVHRASGTEPPAHKSVTGRWCFTHESGIHVAGLLADAETYQAFPPSLVGREHEVAFGKHSGAQSIGYAAERARLTVTEAARKAVLGRVKEAAERKAGRVDEADVVRWIKEEIERQ